MQNQRLFLLISIFLILFSTQVISEKVIVEQNVDQKLTILYPKFENIKINTNFTFHIHVYNTTTGEVLNISEYECIIHIYNKNGQHIIESIMSNNSNSYDKEFRFNNTINNNNGILSYNLWCYKDSNIGGAVSDYFIVTPNGISNNNITGLILGIAVIIFIFLYISFKLDDKHFLLKFILLFLGLFLGILIPRILYNYSYDQISIDFVKYYIRFLYIFTIYVFLYLIWSLLDYYNKTIVIRRFFERKLGYKGGK